MRVRSICVMMAAVLAALGLGTSGQAVAAESCRISVTTILAGHDDTTIDPKLKSHIADLQTMFNYTSYRLLGSESLDLNEGQSGTVSLPGGHRLNVTPRRIQGSRADISLKMTKQDLPVFQTQIQLLNRGSLFVGGPKYLNGNLIFRISGTY